jgi:hypothetical protein
VVLAVTMGAGCSVVGDVVRRPLHGVDLNTASVEEIATLPGLSEADAARIADRRPYQVEGDLVSWGIVSQEQLERFELRTYVSRASGGSCAGIGTPPEPTVSSPEESPDAPSDDTSDESPEDDAGSE